MDNQHQNNLINRIETHGAELERLIYDLRETDGVDPRWVSIGQTHLQQGLMALVRAVEKPTKF